MRVMGDALLKSVNAPGGAETHSPTAGMRGPFCQLPGATMSPAVEVRDVASARMLLRGM